MSQTEHKNINKIVAISAAVLAFGSITTLYARQFCQQSGTRIKSTG